MDKISLKPTTALSPVPAVIVSCGENNDEYNALTIAWTGIINSEPPMTYISVRPERHSYEIIKKCEDFVINIPTVDMLYALDYCGIKSGKNVNKAKGLDLSYSQSQKVKSPAISQCPVSIECKLKDTIHLGSHTMFLAEIVAVSADENYTRNGNLDINYEKTIAYIQGKYYSIGGYLGNHGLSANH